MPPRRTTAGLRIEVALEIPALTDGRRARHELGVGELRRHVHPPRHDRAARRRAPAPRRRRRRCTTRITASDAATAKGMCAIGVVAHGGYGGIPGHGTGVVTIMSGPSERFEIVPRRAGEPARLSAPSRLKEASVSRLHGSTKASCCVTALVGDVTSPSMAANPYEVDCRRRAGRPVGAGGDLLQRQGRDERLGWAADQVEPGVSIANPADAGKRGAASSMRASATASRRQERRRRRRRGRRHRQARGVPLGVQARPRPRRRRRARARSFPATGSSCGVRSRHAGRRPPGDRLPQPDARALCRAWAPERTDGPASRFASRASCPPEVVGMGSGRVSAIDVGRAAAGAGRPRGPAARRPRRDPRLGRDLLHGLPRGRAHRRRRRLRRQPDPRQRRRARRCSSRRPTAVVRAVEDDPSANIAGPARRSRRRWRWPSVRSSRPGA